MTPRQLPPRRRTTDRIVEDDDPVTFLEYGKAIAKYGLPTALLIPLLYFQVVETRADQRDLKSSQAAIIREQQLLAAGILKLADRVGEQQALAGQILLVLRVTCINGTESVSDRNQCLREQ